jgi:hypothetical protein
MHVGLCLQKRYACIEHGCVVDLVYLTLPAAIIPFITIITVITIITFITFIDTSLKWRLSRHGRRHRCRRRRRG